MTFREKLMEERPEKVDDRFGGGCSVCPEYWGLEEVSDCSLVGSDCRACWDREMPEGSE